MKHAKAFNKKFSIFLKLRKMVFVTKSEISRMCSSENTQTNHSIFQKKDRGEEREERFREKEERILNK